jgi:RimJ/RimL family protein N-acetyltransferase
MLEHAFRFVENVVFLIGSNNIRSQKAIEKIGGVRVEKRLRVIHGEVVEHVVYLIKRPA